MLRKKRARALVVVHFEQPSRIGSQRVEKRRYSD
jgi:hypothetical protein